MVRKKYIRKQNIQIRSTRNINKTSRKLLGKPMNKMRRDDSEGLHSSDAFHSHSLLFLFYPSHILSLLPFSISLPNISSMSSCSNPTLPSSNFPSSLLFLSHLLPPFFRHRNPYSDHSV